MQRFLLYLILVFNLNGYGQTYLDFYFKSKDVDGTILIYDQNKDAWLFSDERDVRRKTPVGSLFNLPSALIALDLRVISNKPSEYMPWDGVKRYHFGISDANWNCDTNLDEALAYKTDWYFQNVSDLVRTKNYDFFLKYLNVTDLSYRKKEKYYWHFGGLESTPEQQIQFLRKLKDKKFYFRKENQEYLYSQMLQVSNPKYKIYGYETYNVFKGERIDWWVGVLETKDNNYFFSTRVYEDVNKEEKKDFLTKKFLITIEIFRLLGYI